MNNDEFIFINNNGEEEIIINNYDDYKLYSNIETIIIINKKKLEGYYKNKNNFIYTKIIINNINDLLIFLDNDDNIYNIDYNEIIKDILIKCYNKNHKFYKLNYNEYIVKDGLNNNYLLNTKKFSFDKKENEIITDNLCGKFIINTNLDDIDINIIESILSEIITNKSIIKQYRQLCYNILVEQKEEIIFNDYNNCLLSNWLNNLISLLLKEDEICYFDEKKIISYKQQYKINKPRIIFVDYKDNINNLNNNIKFIQNLGIKNIIIKYKKDNNEYNYKKDYNDIFNSLLINNFFKWCCINKTI